MALDFAWLSNNLDIAYPFKTPAPVITLNSKQYHLGNLIADAAIYLSTTDATSWKLYSLTLTFNWPSAPTSGVITIKSATGSEITFDPTSGATFNAWLYGDWLVTEWTKEVTTPDGFSDYDAVVRLLWAQAPLVSETSFDKNESDWGDPAWFEDGLVKNGPNRVRRAFYKVGDYYFPLGSELLLNGGFNTDLLIKTAGDDTGFRADTVAPPPVRAETTLLLRMVPDAGMGKYLRCTPQDELKTINGLGPDEWGNFHLAPIDCYWLERPLASVPTMTGGQVDQTALVEPHKLQLHNACYECCSCADYVAVYENLSLLWSMAQGVSKRIYSMLDKYKSLRLEFLNRTKGGALIIKAGLVSSPGFSLSVAILIINGGDEVIQQDDTLKARLRFKLAPDEFDVAYVDKTGVAIPPGGDRLYLDPAAKDDNIFELDFTTSTMLPGQQALWSGHFTVEPNETIARTDANVTVTADLQLNGSTVDSDTKAAELKAAEMRP